MATWVIGKKAVLYSKCILVYKTVKPFMEVMAIVDYGQVYMIPFVLSIVLKGFSKRKQRHDRKLMGIICVSRPK